MSSAQFLLRMRPYFRQVAGELVPGSLCGIVMNTAVVLPALLLGRAIDEVVRLSRGESTAGAVTLAALLVVAGTLTEVPRIGKRWWLMTANARIRGSIRADVFRGVVVWPMARLHRTPIGDIMARRVGAGCCDEATASINSDTDRSHRRRFLDPDKTRIVYLQGRQSARLKNLSTLREQLILCWDVLLRIETLRAWNGLGNR